MKQNFQKGWIYINHKTHCQLRFSIQTTSTRLAPSFNPWRSISLVFLANGRASGSILSRPSVIRPWFNATKRVNNFGSSSYCTKHTAKKKTDGEVIWLVIKLEGNPFTDGKLLMCFLSSYYIPEHQPPKIDFVHFQTQFQYFPTSVPLSSLQYLEHQFPH